ncbi:kinase-like protein [Exidia glandulosa HHB12029]|uniref:non-specific serine/threonine protein kinase n=1 Tax=Exidia glandulosa HHB12029 TaxID=1314781 RepID=A0A166ADH5_EXIGL|nr:kinase-like protein [Exidia glandulosa HHB12029]
MSDCLENYELGDLIATGSSSKVYRADCKRGRIRGRTVAIKMISLESSPRALPELDESSALHKRLHHPSIVTLYSSFVTSDKTCYCQVLEFCPRGPYQRKDDDGELALRGLLPSLVEGLLHVERAGIVHGAVQPGNVLAGESGRVKLSNFTAATVKDASEDWSRDIRDLGRFAAWVLSGRYGEDDDAENESFLGQVLISSECHDLVSRMLRKSVWQIPLREVLAHPFLVPPARTDSRARTVSFSSTNKEPDASKASKTTVRRMLGDITNVPVAPLRVAHTITEKKLVARDQVPASYPPSPPITTGDNTPESLRRVAVLDEERRVQALASSKAPSTGRLGHSGNLAGPTAFSVGLLPPQVHKTGQGSLTIQPSRALLVDLREGARRNKKKGDEVLLISPTGNEISVFSAPHLSVPCVLSEAKETYQLEDLPERYWQTYRFAADFIDAIKRRTPQAVFLIAGAQCTLMSNEPLGDVEVKFSAQTDAILGPRRAQQDKSSQRIVISRGKGTVELASHSESEKTSMSIKRTCAFRPDRSASLGLGRDDEAALNGDERSRMRLAMKCLRLCEAYEALEFRGEAEEEASKSSTSREVGDLKNVAMGESFTRLSICVEPRPRWSPAVL